MYSALAGSLLPTEPYIVHLNDEQKNDYLGASVSLNDASLNRTSETSKTEQTVDVEYDEIIDDDYYNDIPVEELGFLLQPNDVPPGTDPKQPHRMLTSAENPNFVADYFASSRLHHLSRCNLSIIKTVTNC